MPCPEHWITLPTPIQVPVLNPSPHGLSKILSFLVSPTSSSRHPNLHHLNPHPCPLRHPRTNSVIVEDLKSRRTTSKAQTQPPPRERIPTQLSSSAHPFPFPFIPSLPSLSPPFPSSFPFKGSQGKYVLIHPFEIGDLKSCFTLFTGRSSTGLPILDSSRRA